MDESKQLIPSQSTDIMAYALQPQKIVEQVKFIQDVMAQTMKEEVHFGVIPGTQNKTLYKLGADKLSFTFRFSPSYEIKQVDLDRGHRDYFVTCHLTHIPTGANLGQGVGSCSTMESKYRYRDSGAELTDNPVPNEYWDLKRANKLEAAAAIIGGKGFKIQKGEDGAWYIAKKTGAKVEHPDPADYYNTCLKMAKKRAHIDAILTATAAGDIFRTAEPSDDTDPETSPRRQKKRQQEVEPMELETSVSQIVNAETLPELTTWRNKHAKSIDASPDKQLINEAFKARLDVLKKGQTHPGTEHNNAGQLKMAGTEE